METREKFSKYEIFRGKNFESKQEILNVGEIFLSTVKKN